jgi:hypothetical protein
MSGLPQRYKLYNGVVYALAPARAAHAGTKHAVANAPSAAIATHFDASAKPAGYCKLESVRDYLIVDPEKRVDSRPEGDPIATRLASKGTLDLSPPGLRVRIASCSGS